jgi:hypothetical protein
VFIAVLLIVVPVLVASKVSDEPALINKPGVTEEVLRGLNVIVIEVLRVTVELPVMVKELKSIGLVVNRTVTEVLKTASSDIVGTPLLQLPGVIQLPPLAPIQVVVIAWLLLKTIKNTMQNSRPLFIHGRFSGGQDEKVLQRAMDSYVI